MTHMHCYLGNKKKFTVPGTMAGVFTISCMHFKVIITLLIDGRIWVSERQLSLPSSTVQRALYRLYTQVSFFPNHAKALRNWGFYQPLPSNHIAEGPPTSLLDMEIPASIIWETNCKVYWIAFPILSLQSPKVKFSAVNAYLLRIFHELALSKA